MKLHARPQMAVLLSALRDRDVVGSFSDAEWQMFLSQAESTRLLPRLAIELQQLRLISVAPRWAQDRLAAAAVRGRQFEREIRWEVRCIQRALRAVGADPVFLKGAAYVCAELPHGRGRVVADIDILVADADLGRVEAALARHGWHFDELHPYDERYYREWMHELPPMRHRERGTLLDVHHRLLPRTGRVHPPTPRLLAHASAVAGVRVLSAEHRLLHAAAHMFQDGEIAGELRDLVDLAEMLAQVDTSPKVAALADEAACLDLGRPLFYAARYATLVTQRVIPEFEAWRPAAPILALADYLIPRATMGVSPTASAALRARAQWLKMPPWRLLKHLTAKSLRAVEKTFSRR